MAGGVGQGSNPPGREWGGIKNMPILVLNGDGGFKTRWHRAIAVFFRRPGR